MYGLLLTLALMGQIEKNDFKLVGTDSVFQTKNPDSEMFKLTGGVLLKPIPPAPIRQSQPKQQPRVVPKQQQPLRAIPQEAVVPRRVYVPQVQYYSAPQTYSYMYSGAGAICLPGGS